MVEEASLEQESEDHTGSSPLRTWLRADRRPQMPRFLVGIRKWEIPPGWVRHNVVIFRRCVVMSPTLCLNEHRVLMSAVSY